MRLVLCRGLLAILAAIAIASWSIAAEPVQRKVVWNLDELQKAPAVHPATDRPAKGMRTLFFEGVEYKGKPTWVFAYYAAPQGEPPAGGWPAVVCAHGGGGSAFPAWVREWNKHGYAAIAMDLEGHLPGGRFFGVEGNFPSNVGHPNAGPARVDWFGDRDLPDNQQWFYHAVADVVRANTLLRSFPEINAKKIGLTGISWGGTIVSTVAGIDPRFAFVIPVYGGGFIHESDNPGLAQWFPPKNMTAEQFRDYRAKWDPSIHLPEAKMPMLWVSSFSDLVFQVDIFEKSARAAGGPSTLCLRPWLIHGHGYGWEEAWEIYVFADSVVKGGPPLPHVDRPQLDPQTGLVHAKYSGKLESAHVYYTTSGGKWKDRKWQKIPCEVVKDELISKGPLPKGATALNINAMQKPANLISSELLYLEKK